MKKLEPDLETFLKKWPAPSRPEPSWDVQADTITKSVETAPTMEDPDTRDAIAVLLASPALPAEPGEPGLPSRPDPSGAMPAELRVSGDRTMSDDKENGPAASSQPSAADSLVPTPSVPVPSQPVPSQRSDAPRSKRQSLREIAERARSSTPAPARVSSAGSTPLPGALATPLPAAPSSNKSAVSTPLPRPATSTPLPRPIEAGKDDSGIVDLNTIQNKATSEQVAAAAAAKPASEGLFDEDEKAAAAAPASAKVATAKAAAKPAAAAPPKKGSGGAVAGIAIAVIGLAAAFAIWQRGQVHPQTTPTAPVAAETSAPATPGATGEVAAAPAPSEEPAAAGPVAQNDMPRPGPGFQPPRPGAAPAAPATAADPKATPPAPGTPPVKGPEKPGDLAGAMEKAVGPTDKTAEGPAEPASGSKGSSSIPEQPPQGSVSAAVGSVMGGAKACVAGADDVSRATITFSSSGAVSSVSVTGWAASHGATGCVTSALKAAKVGAFSKPTYSVGVTIRP